jgi:hypothetical protein
MIMGKDVDVHNIGNIGILPFGYLLWSYDLPAGSFSPVADDTDRKPGNHQQGNEKCKTVQIERGFGFLFINPVHRVIAEGEPAAGATGFDRFFSVGGNRNKKEMKIGPVDHDGHVEIFTAVAAVFMVSIGLNPGCPGSF